MLLGCENRKKLKLLKIYQPKGRLYQPKIETIYFGLTRAQMKGPYSGNSKTVNVIVLSYLEPKIFRIISFNLVKDSLKRSE